MQDSPGPDGRYKRKIDPISQEHRNDEDEGENIVTHKLEKVNAEMCEEGQIDKAGHYLGSWAKAQPFITMNSLSCGTCC
jgi:hypothetical protein